MYWGSNGIEGERILGIRRAVCVGTATLMAAFFLTGNAGVASAQDWLGDCPKGSICAYSGVSGSGKRCNWAGNDANWAGGARPCSFSGKVKSLWNNGNAGNLDDVHLVTCGGAHWALLNGQQEAWTNPTEDPGRGHICIKSHKWFNR